jgi:TRAP-type uncharacterized transport system substrate-binding protein
MFMSRASLLANLANLALAAAVAFTGQNVVLAKSLTGTDGNPEAKEVHVNVGCGKLDKANCAIIVPTLNDKTSQHGVTLEAADSEGSIASAQAICNGQVEAMVGQLDAIDQVRRSGNCASKIDVAVPAVTPYEAYFVLRANAGYSTLADMVKQTPSGKVLNIAAGKIGSGGRTTFEYILNAFPEYRQTINLVNYDETTALSKLEEGTIDGYFVMDGPGSPLVEEIKKAVDPATKGPKFKFADMRISDDLNNKVKALNNIKMYSTVVLAPGFWSDIKTLSVPTAIAVSSKWRETPDNARAVDVIKQAVIDARANLKSAVYPKTDWTPEAALK